MAFIEISMNAIGTVVATFPGRCLSQRLCRGANLLERLGLALALGKPSPGTTAAEGTRSRKLACSTPTEQWAAEALPTHARSSTSLTFLVTSTDVNGLARKCVPASSTPW